MSLEKLCAALSVTGDLLGKLYAYNVQCLAECVICLACFGDLRIACQSVCDNDYCIVSGCVTVNAYLVIAVGNLFMKSLAYELLADGTVCRYEAEHGAHVDMDHAASLCNASEGTLKDCLQAQASTVRKAQSEEVLL